MNLMSSERSERLPELFNSELDKTDWTGRRNEIRDILMRDMYGYMPEAMPTVEAEYMRENIGFAGKAITGLVNLHCRFDNTLFSFAVRYAFPVKTRVSPAVVHISFEAEMPNKYLPAEEIIDSGFGIAQFYYQDIVNDRLNGDFSNGLGLAYFNGRKRRPSDWGKLGIWAYAACRVIDWLYTRPEVDSRHIMVAGHSRLGKAALWAGANDERVYATFVNESGAGGAAIMRGKAGERIADFLNSGMWDWFSESYKNFAGNEYGMPFDSHFALALIAPRLVCVGSAADDLWADPPSEFLACRCASPAWENLGFKGLIAPDEGAIAEHDAAYTCGRVGYQQRSGAHYFSRSDWNTYIRFAKAHMAADALS